MEMKEKGDLQMEWTVIGSLNVPTAKKRKGSQGKQHLKDLCPYPCEKRRNHLPLDGERSLAKFNSNTYSGRLVHSVGQSMTMIHYFLLFKCKHTTGGLPHNGPQKEEMKSTCRRKL